MISKDDLVDGVYRALLAREADPDGRASFVAMLEKGTALEVLIHNILVSEEFTQLRIRQYGESADALRGRLVDALYQALLLRKPDATGREVFLNRLGDGEELETLIKNILTSPEYHERLARERDDLDTNNGRLADALYRALLLRDPEPEARVSVVNTLRMGVGLDQLIHDVVHSDEYQNLIHRDDLVFDRFKPVCTLLKDRLKLWVDLHDLHVSLGCLQDNYEPLETAFVLDRLSPGDTFVDIGANVGWFTIQAADRVGPTGRVHSFEPRTQTHGLLTRSISDNGFKARCTVHKVALAATEAKSRLVWMPGTENPGGSRLVRDETEMVDDMAGEAVRMVTLDSVAIEGRVPVVKLDVEGAEAMVLKGAGDFLKRHRPVILTEVFGQALRHVSKVDLPEFVAIIQGLGYAIHDLDDGQVGHPITDLATLETPGPISCVLVPS